MSKRKALGKGLSSLIPETPLEGVRPPGVLQLDVGVIRPNPRQPRKAFDEAGLGALADSIKTHGVLQPVIVRRDGDNYELVVGERRWRAAMAAGLRQIPAIVRDVDERTRLEAALVENLQRQDLNPLEEARACEMLVETFGLTHDDLATRLGKSRPHISNLLRILHLTDLVLSRVETGELSLGHVKALAAVTDSAAQERLAARVVEGGLNVRQTEELVAAFSAPAEQPGDAAKIKKSRELRADPNVRDAEERLKRALGAGVHIRGRGKKGRIEIEFTGLDELQRLFELLERAAGAATPPPAAKAHHVQLPGQRPVENVR